MVFKSKHMNDPWYNLQIISTKFPTLQIFKQHFQIKKFIYLILKFCDYTKQRFVFEIGSIQNFGELSVHYQTIKWNSKI